MMYLLSFAILAIVSPLCGMSYCSLHVSVNNTAGDESIVIVEEKSGWKTEKETSKGQASFCGLGISPVAISVGRPGCNQVVLREVPLKWNETRYVSVVYDRAPCLEDVPPVAACAFLFRFVGLNHNPIKGASLLTRAPFAGRQDADEYGRLFLRIAAGQELVGRCSARGYLSQDLDVRCDSRNQRFEKLIVLQEEPLRK